VPPVQRVVRLLLGSFRARRWSDNCSAALLIAEAMEQSGQAFDEQTIHVVPGRFFEDNEVSAEVVARYLQTELANVRVDPGAPLIVPIEDIGSFSKAASVSSSDVADIARPLQLAERDVKELVGRILGEPRVDKDWGGEADDLFSSRVDFRGAKIPATFIFKGPAKKGPLTLSKLGRNGDQLERMLGQPAQLFIVQHCDTIRPAVRNYLRRGIIALRVEGNVNATGSIWEGSDCARLLVAHGFIDQRTGKRIR